MAAGQSLRSHKVAVGERRKRAATRRKVGQRFPALSPRDVITDLINRTHRRRAERSGSRVSS